VVEAIVQNQGDLGTQNGFYTDLYADHQPTGPGDYTNSIRYWVASPVDASNVVTFSTIVTQGTLGDSDPAPLQETSKTLYVQADSTGVVGEADEGNNVTQGVEACLASADAYEDDNSSQAAGWLLLGAPQTHNMHAPGDQDWLRFQAQQGITYTIRTSTLGLSADTYLYLYDTDGSALLNSNDDSGGSLASQIDWVAPADGTYYALVKHWNPSVYGCETFYDLSINEGRSSPLPNEVYLPLILKHSVSGPDLVVDSLIATSDAVTVTIKNQGNVPVTDAFWVDVYFNPSVTPSLNQPWDTIASYGMVWGVTTPIAPNGGILILTSGGDYYFPEYSSPAPLPVGADVYALVDSINFGTSYGTVLESNEENNLLGPVTSTTGVAGEAASVGNQGRSPSMERLPPRQ
jgi:hypothetical protein